MFGRLVGGMQDAVDFVASRRPGRFGAMRSPALGNFAIFTHRR
jgi:hypothetical protein